MKFMCFGSTLSYPHKEFLNLRLPSTRTKYNPHPQCGPSPAGGPVVPGPPIWNPCPHFTFGSPVAAYIQSCILKMWPPFGLLAPLLLHPGDGPDTYAKQCGCPHPPRKCGYPHPARVNPPRARLYHTWLSLPVRKTWVLSEHNSELAKAITGDAVPPPFL